MYEEITSALQRGADETALAAARKAVVDNGNDPRAHQLLAMALSRTGAREEALAHIDEAILLAPGDSDLHFQRAGHLMRMQETAEAGASLARSVELNPNQFGAYLLQAQIALGQRNVEEAERLSRLMARLSPDHPWLVSLQAMIALRRGDPDRAIGSLSEAQKKMPDDPQVLRALGFAYLEKGHLAFAEQAFRRLAERYPDDLGLRVLLAELLGRQGRFEDALTLIQPALQAGHSQSGAINRLAGRLELGLGRPRQALERLKTAIESMPADPATIELLASAWLRLGETDGARAMFDAALEAAPGSLQLWRARLSVEPDWKSGAAAVIERWIEAMPDHVAPLEAKMEMLAATEDHAGAEPIARRIIELQPGHLAAQGRVVDSLMRTRPDAAVERVRELLAQETDEQRRRQFRNWLALAYDAAGRHRQAVDLWLELHEQSAPRLIPLWEHSPPQSVRRVEPVPAGDMEKPVPAVFMVGTPGSGVEHAALVLRGCLPRFRADRYGLNRPNDHFQNINTIPALIAGRLKPSEVVDSWRAALPKRGITDGSILDWLLWWDNSLVDVLKQHLPFSRLIFILRDPRDILLNWLATGAHVPLRFTSIDAASGWLAKNLSHVARLHEESLLDHRLIRIDDAVNDPWRMAECLGRNLGHDLPAPPRNLFETRRFPSGHWRGYAEPLAGAFALLTPVAVRLGYPET